MESHVPAPMHHGRLLLAGDVAHSVTPCGGKGMNMAIQDALVLGELIPSFIREGGELDLFELYSERRLPVVWRAQDFSHMMLYMLHKPEGAGDREELAYLQKLKQARLGLLEEWPSFARFFAQGYVGIS